MKIKAVLFVLFTAVMAVPGGIAVAFDAEGAYTIFGQGGHSCAKFLKEDKEDKEDDIDYLFYKIWVVGFISAAGVYQNTQKSLGDVADVEGIIYLIRKYCEKNPLDSLATATITIADQVIDRAGRQ